ncbi:ribonuclease P protein subunit p29-like isoform X1 [Centruroides sculpturatus]|uniref:ribonuclease P protein subunit p29-like isoform X1 n=2 Tax=Centruroides sculpturatus TaxID=218467 RepID=UPI000C6ED6D9|nr:ribonuclease P protein subunit p29-like isoform X1 [Centruroides sculpturatus]
MIIRLSRITMYKQYTEFPKEWKEVGRSLGVKEVSNAYVSAFLKNRAPHSKLDGVKEKIFDLTSSIVPKKKEKIIKKKSYIAEKIRKIKLDKKTQFSSFVPLHELWKQYMDDILPDNILSLQNNSAELLHLLQKADYHGCYLVVAASKCSPYVGCKGIVIMETKNTFRIVTPKNIVKTIPKNNTTFAFELKGKIFKIYGSHFRHLPGERCRAKFKSK